MINRREFSLAAAAAASLAACRSTPAASPTGSTPASPTTGAGTHTSFPSIKQIDAGLLNIGYAEAGPADGPVVMLLHGWPYDIYSYVDVAPLLAAKGYRVIVPYLRGYGTTQFLSSNTFRNAQQSVVALDIIALWMLSRSRGPSSAASIGVRGLPTSSRRSGRNAARHSSR